MLRDAEIRTGEAVAIRYELAGLGSRFLAVVIDGIAQVLVMVALVIAFALAGRALEGLRLTRVIAGPWGIAIFVVVTFLVLFGWFMIFETWWSGRTPGKRIMGIRVLRDGGFPVDAGAAIIRNLVRVLEAGLGFYAISALSTLISKENKRLGDLAAGTIVVRDRVEARPDLDAYLARASRTDTGLPDSDRVLIERFLARRPALEASARARLAAQLAERVRLRLRASYDHLDDESLLEFLGGESA